jgi:hypothetical protein
LGYADDGEEHFYDPDLNADEPLVDKSGEAKGKKGKGALSADAMKRAKNANQFKHGGQNQKVSSMFVRNSKNQSIGPGMDRADKKRKQEKKEASAGFGELNLDNLLEDLTANPMAIKKKQKKSKKKKGMSSGLAFFQSGGGGGSSTASRRKAEEAIFSKSGAADGAEDEADAADSMDVDAADDAPMDEADTADEPAAPVEAPKISRRDRLMKAAKTEKVEVSAAAKALLSDVKEEGSRVALSTDVGGNHLNTDDASNFWATGGEQSVDDAAAGAAAQVRLPRNPLLSHMQTKRLHTQPRPPLSPALASNSKYTGNISPSLSPSRLSLTTARSPRSRTRRACSSGCSGSTCTSITISPASFSSSVKYRFPKLAGRESPRLSLLASASL